MIIISALKEIHIEHIFTLLHIECFLQIIFTNVHTRSDMQDKIIIDIKKIKGTFIVEIFQSCLFPSFRIHRAFKY